eukprot:5458933-Karenia_brevis.AAC.1
MRDCILTLPRRLRRLPSNAGDDGCCGKCPNLALEVAAPVVIFSTMQQSRDDDDDVVALPGIAHT